MLGANPRDVVVQTQAQRRTIRAMERLRFLAGRDELVAQQRCVPIDEVVDDPPLISKLKDRCRELLHRHWDGHEDTRCRALAV